MSEYDGLIDGFEGAPSSEGERRPDVAEVPGSTPGGLIDAAREEAVVLSPAPERQEDLDEPPIEPDDWPEPESEIPVFPTSIDLRALKPDQRPQVGVHFVVFNGRPMPVLRAFGSTEDEFVRDQISPVEDLKDPDGGRRGRADRTLRMRYRGYVCGEMRSL